VFDIGVDAQALRVRVRQIDIERLTRVLNEISSEFLTRPHDDDDANEEANEEDGTIGAQTAELCVSCVRKTNPKRVASTMKVDVHYMDVVFEEEIVDDRCVKGVLLQMNTVQAMTIATTCVPCTRFHLSVRKMQMVERDDVGDQDVLRHSKRLGEVHCIPINSLFLISLVIILDVRENRNFFSMTHEWMYGCMDVWMYGCMDVWMYGLCV
jgi:hypothetical protein